MGALCVRRVPSAEGRAVGGIPSRGPGGGAGAAGRIQPHVSDPAQPLARRRQRHADSSVLGAVILFLLVVLIATSSRSGGGVASRGFQYAGYNKATLPTAPKPTKKEIQQL